jgi:hypothetical protein
MARMGSSRVSQVRPKLTMTRKDLVMMQSLALGIPALVSHPVKRTCLIAINESRP